MKHTYPQPGKPSSAPSGPARRGMVATNKGGATMYAPNAAGSSHHVPPLPPNLQAAASTDMKGRSLISQKQRDALQISAFGFNTKQGTTRRDDADTSTMSRNKLERALHTTGKSEPVVARTEKNSARFNLCVEALAEGCLQTYMHLFELSHREPICVDVLSGTLFAISDDRLKWVQEELSLVEVCRRQSEFEEVFQHCQALADYFEGERDMEEAVWHYLAALQYAQESLDRSLEQRTRRTLAAFYERHGRYADAVQQFEAMYSLASALGDTDVAREACVDLARLYHIQGEQLLATNPEAAKAFFEKESRAAKRSKSGLEEGRALDALGRAHERTGDLERALQYHRSSRVVAQREHLDDKEVQAALSAAALEERLGHTEAATASLQGALELAKKLGDPAKVCQATMQLGEACRTRQQSLHEMGDTEGEEESMRYRTTCFREAFGAACASGQQDLIDAARIAMGFAIGEYYFKKAGDGRGYIPIVCDDIRAQLEWMSNGRL